MMSSTTAEEVSPDTTKPSSIPGHAIKQVELMAPLSSASQAKLESLGGQGHAGSLLIL